MRATLNFWINPSTNERWLRMDLEGRDWPSDWSVEYKYLESWGMFDWFYAPPLDPKGFVAGQKYRMSNTPQAQEFAGFLDNLHTLISQIKPVANPESGLTIRDSREYD